MRMNDATTEDARIEQLRKRDSEIRARIVALNEQKRRREAKLLAREFSAMGELLCTHAAQSQEFHAALKRLVAAAITGASEPMRRFLAERRWL